MVLTSPAIVRIGMTAALFIGLALIVYGSLAKNDWGVNFDPVKCPRCSISLDYTRAQKSRKQALWGGYTCPKCECETDKWGREIPVARVSG